MRKKTYNFTATVSDGKHHDSECEGIVKASSEAEARRAVADWVVEDGRKKKRNWNATTIEFT
jgi:hypothetical protein